MIVISTFLLLIGFIIVSYGYLIPIAYLLFMGIMHYPNITPVEIQEIATNTFFIAVYTYVAGFVMIGFGGYIFERKERLRGFRVWK